FQPSNELTAKSISGWHRLPFRDKPAVARVSATARSFSAGVFPRPTAGFPQLICEFSETSEFLDSFPRRKFQVFPQQCAINIAHIYGDDWIDQTARLHICSR